MTRTYALILALVMGLLPAMAHYSVKKVSGHVQLKSGATTVAATPGMQIKAADLIIIGSDSSIDILDSIDSQIYTANTPGQVTVTRIMFDAKKKARSNAGTVHDKIRMGKSADHGDGVVFVDKGKVTRALASYDPEAGDVQVDVDMLSRKIYGVLSGSLDEIAGLETSVVVRDKRTDNNGLRFMVENTLSFPVYFNLLKLSGDGRGAIAVSELGQPVGSYVLQPDQSIAREQNTGIDAGERHLLIMTNYYFEIDELLTKINELISAGAEVDSPADFPLYMRII